MCPCEISCLCHGLADYGRRGRAVWHIIAGNTDRMHHSSIDNTMTRNTRTHTRCAPCEGRARRTMSALTGPIKRSKFDALQRQKGKHVRTVNTKTSFVVLRVGKLAMAFRPSVHSSASARNIVLVRWIGIVVQGVVRFIAIL